MLKRLFLGTAFSLALLLAPLATADAHDKGRKHKHGRGTFWTTRDSSRNWTPGTPRRVRRGRNWTPGVRRGRVGFGTADTFPNDEGRHLGRITRQSRERGDGWALGRAAGNNSRGRGRGKH
jgi:hypothetical protein